MSTDATTETPTRTYYIVFLVLMVCTYATWQIAYFDLGRLNTVAALAIAGLKASLVIWFFMHARSGPRLTPLVVFGGLLWMFILFGLTAGDYLAR
jgi:cytochrome c oxidase subunit IV